MKNLWTLHVYNLTSNRVGGLTPDEASELIAKAKEDMISLKERLDKDRQKQEMALAKRLGDMKRKKLNQMVGHQFIHSHILCCIEIRRNIKLIINKCYEFAF